MRGVLPVAFPAATPYFPLKWPGSAEYTRRGPEASHGISHDRPARSPWGIWPIWPNIAHPKFLSADPEPLPGIGGISNSDK